MSEQQIPEKMLNQVQTAPPTGAQPQAASPLDQLRDIHLPEQIEQFPYAPGWWILLTAIILLVCFYLYKKLQYKKAIKLLIPAKKELQELRELPSDQIGAHDVAVLSALLKRICLIYFPKISVAALNGNQWLTFLNQQFKNSQNSGGQETTPLFSDSDMRFFSTVAYQKSPQIKTEDWGRLLSSSERCIESIIKTAAKKKNGSTTSVKGENR